MGSIVFVPSEKIERMMMTTSDSKFLRDAMRTIWTPEQLHGRSLTGQPRQRKKKDGESGKRALTPRKLVALNNAFEKYIERRPCPKGLSPQERLRAKNRVIADYLKKM